MVSLKKSMKWDEDVYGLEYDLVRGKAIHLSNLTHRCNLAH
jgi:aminopeptidase N